MGDRLGDERTRRGDLLDLALALADDHRLATTPYSASWIAAKTSSTVCSPSTSDLGSYDPVALDHQLRELVVETQPGPDRLGRVVGASFLDRPAAEPLRGDLVGDLEQDHGVERLADLLQHRVERLGLRHGARKPVQHEPVLVARRSRMSSMVRSSGTRPPLSRIGATCTPELGAVRDGSAEDVAGRDVRHVVRRGDPLGLSSLAGALWAENEYPHRSLGRYLRKPS